MDTCFRIKIILGIGVAGFALYMLWFLGYVHFVTHKTLAAPTEEKFHPHILMAKDNAIYSSIRNTNKNSQDPYGWRNFKWGMTKEQAQQLGAKPFRDNRGAKRFGLADIGLFPEIRYQGKRFWVDLGFYSHIGLASILIQKKAQKICAKDEYENLLKGLREEYGREKEAKDLEYPNARFLSHVWIVGFTKVALNHSCNKPSNSVFSNQSFLLSIRFESRYGL